MSDRIKKMVIQPQKGWVLIDWKELWEYKDLVYFLIWREIKTRYAQSVLGIGWAVIQPLFSMVIFTIVFGNLAKIDSNGVPYSIFSFSGLVPWTYFSTALSTSAGSLVASKAIITKVYFPRLIIPLAPIFSKLIDFIIAFFLLIVMVLFYGFSLSFKILLIPGLIMITILTASGMGMWLSALSVQYRDLNYATGFFIQLLLYLAPVVYPASNIPEDFRIYYGLFPMVGVIESFRSILLDTIPIPLDFIITGSVVAIILFVSGMFYFKRIEKYFADVV